VVAQKKQGTSAVKTWFSEDWRSAALGMVTQLRTGTLFDKALDAGNSLSQSGFLSKIDAPWMGQLQQASTIVTKTLEAGAHAAQGVRRYAEAAKIFGDILIRYGEDAPLDTSREFAELWLTDRVRSRPPCARARLTARPARRRWRSS
jgi:hypothetical protein